MLSISEAVWKEIIKNKPNKVTAFDIYKDFCKNLHGSDITNNQIKMDWDTMTGRQIRDLQKKADIKNLEHEKNIENWLNYYGVTQQIVGDYVKAMKERKANEQKEKKRNLSQKNLQELKKDENIEEKSQAQKQAQVILRKVKKENKQPIQKSISPDNNSTNQIIHQEPILVRKKNVQLEKETPIHQQRSKKQVRFEQVKEDSPFQDIKSDQKPIRITD